MHLIILYIINTHHQWFLYMLYTTVNIVFSIVIQQGCIGFRDTQVVTFIWDIKKKDKHKKCDTCLTKYGVLPDDASTLANELMKRLECKWRDANKSSTI